MLQLRGPAGIPAGIVYRLLQLLLDHPSPSRSPMQVDAQIASALGLVSLDWKV